MKITIVGAGAIGSVLGAYLIREGKNVEFVDINTDHIKDMNERGLEIRAFEGPFRVAVKAFTPEQYILKNETIECLLLCVKNQHIKEALKPLLPLMKEYSFVVSTQNGLCEADIAKVVGNGKTLSSFVSIGADYLEPGLVHYGWKGLLTVGETNGEISPRLRILEKEMSPLDIFQTTNNIMGYKWLMIAYGAIIAAASLTHDMVVDIIENSCYQEMLANLCTEVLELANSIGIEFNGIEFDNFNPSYIYPREMRDYQKMQMMFNSHANLIRISTKVRSGIWRDIVVRKRKSEVTYCFEPIFRLAEKEGIKMPMCHAMLDIFSDIENGKRKISMENLEELLQKDITTYSR